MKQRKGAREYTTTRAVYKAAKKYDHLQFDRFCTNIYAEGFKDGAESVPGVDEKEVIAKISEIKGIGAVRLGKIREAVEELFKEKENREKEETGE